MSINSEIERLKAAKASIKAAIEAEGGTVQEETLDSYAAILQETFGRYYTPSVTQPSKTTMQISFTASKTGMDEVDPVTITLPGPDVECTTADNGKFLRVVNGEAKWATVDSAEGASF